MGCRYSDSRSLIASAVAVVVLVVIALMVVVELLGRLVWLVLILLLLLLPLPEAAVRTVLLVTGGLTPATDTAAVVVSVHTNARAELPDSFLLSTARVNKRDLSTRFSACVVEAKCTAGSCAGSVGQWL